MPIIGRGGRFVMAMQVLPSFHVDTGGQHQVADFDCSKVFVFFSPRSIHHEMDITSFIDTMEELYKAAEGDSNLKRIRENRGLSQAELAEQSGVNLRNIQMYEQRVNGMIFTDNPG